MSEMTRVLIIESEAIPLHRLRIESRRSEIPFLYDSVSTLACFHRLFAQGPGIVVSTLHGLDGIPLREMMDFIREAKVPLFIVGGDTLEERELLAEMAGLFAACCRRNRLPWLPMLLERALREFTEAKERPESLSLATAQLQRAAEQMREVQKLAIIGRLTGSIVHEINNPLESITNLNYLLSVDDQLPSHLRSYVALAEQELRRVTQISKQTLSFYRETQTPVRTELSSLLEEVLVLYAHRLGEKQITITRHYDSEETVLLFPGEMRQVFANLLANAIEATPSGGRVALRIHRASRSTPEGHVDGVRVLIADSGSGIPPELQMKLGQPFFTTKGQRGTGLGLWVSQAIVKRYNGAIRLRSSISPDRQGTTFSIFLPLNLGPQAVSPKPAGDKANVFQENSPALDGLRLRRGRS